MLERCWIGSRDHGVDLEEGEPQEVTGLKVGDRVDRSFTGDAEPGTKQVIKAIAKSVTAAAPGHGVVAGVALQDVMSAPTVQDIGAVGTAQGIVACGPVDGRGQPDQ